MVFLFSCSMGKLNCFVKKKTATAISYKNTYRHHPIYHRRHISLVSSPLLVPPSRFSFMRLVSIISSIASRLSSRFRYRHPSPCLIHLISYRCHLATSQIPTSANTDKNELDKTAQPYRPAPAEPTGTRETRRHRHNIA